MAATAVENPVPVNTGESKSARKKKAKAEAAANSTHGSSPAVPDQNSHDNSVVAEDASGEHPYLKELQKQIRNTSKKLSSMAKTDSIIAENPGVSLDDLVAQRKLNQDQRAAALKKPQLQAQLAELEERSEHYRKFDQDYQVKFSKQRDELAAQHEQATSKLREELKAEALEAAQKELRQKLLTFSQFLRAAAAKRITEDESGSEESAAFEGALLLVYGGDQKAVDTAMNLIEGSNERVPNIEGVTLNVTYAQVKKASIEHAPFQAEEEWAEQVAEATSGEIPAESTSDPTVVNAGLTELEAPSAPNGAANDGIPEPTNTAVVSSGDASGNLAGERWDADAGAEKGGLEESYEIVPRAPEEVDTPVETPVTATEQPQSTSWADQSHEAASGNQAGESWDTKAAGETENAWGADTATTATNGWGDAPGDAPAPTDDGFHEVSGRRGGRGRGRGGDGEFRGRGGRRGNFRGGRGEHRGGFRRGDGGEFRGGRGRGRGGPRGGAEGAAPRGS